MKYRTLIYFSLLILLLINFTLFDRFFPPTEGWWQTYAYLIDKGLLIFRDFNVNLSPVFIFFNYFLVRIIGYDFYLIRIIGILIVILNYILLYKYLSKIFSKENAVISSFLATILFIKDPTYIPNDYHTFMNLFVLLIFNISNIYIIQINDDIKKAIFCLIIIGILNFLLIFIKQNVGIFLLISYCFSILLLENKIKRNIAFLLIYIFSILFMFVVLVIILNKYDINFNPFNFIFKNDSKGNVFVVLFRFMEFENFKKILSGFVIFIFILVFKSIDKIKYKSLIANIYQLTLPILFMILLGSYYIEKKISFSIFKIYIPISIGVYFYITNVLFYNKTYLINKKIFFYYFPNLILAYSSTNTAGFSFTGLYFFIAFSYAYLLEKLENVFLDKSKYVKYFFILTFIPVWINKIFVPYNWWGLKQSSIFNSVYCLHNSKFGCIKVDKPTYIFFNDLNSLIKNNSKEISDVYIFPNIPLFYLLNNKISPTKNLLQWFDVITDKQIREEMNYLKINKPRLVILLIPPLFVFKGHYELTKRELLQKNIIDWMNNLYLNGKYKLLLSKVYLDVKERCFSKENIEYLKDCNVNVWIRLNKKYANYRLFCLIEKANKEYYAILKRIKFYGFDLELNKNILLSNQYFLNFELNINNVNEFVSEFGEVIPFVGEDIDNRYENGYYIYKVYLKNN